MKLLKINSEKFLSPLLKVVLLVAVCSVAAAQDPVKNIGNIKKINTSAQTINIITDNAFASITVYSPKIGRAHV